MDVRRYGLFLCVCIILFVNINLRKSDVMNRKIVRQAIKTESSEQKAITDCGYTLAEALKGKNIPANIKSRLVIVDVEYYSFDGKLHAGQLVVNKDLAKDIIGIFKEIKKIKFPVAKVIPVCAYDWSDSASMSDDNTSAFNYRFIKGTKKLSNHALGRAVDINPLFNPQIKKDEILPPNGSYKSSRPGTITRNSPVVEFFKKKGWIWGGDWKSSKDYQHFEKLK